MTRLDAGARSESSRKAARGVAGGSDGKGGFLAFWTTIPGLISAIAALVTALATAGLIVAHDPNGPDPTPSPAPTTTSPVPTTTSPVPTTTPAPRPTPGAASVSVLARLRPESGQVSETMRLLLDGRVVASWTLTTQQSTRTVVLTGLAEGEHSYVLAGSYTFVDPMGVVENQPASGEGSVTVSQGLPLQVVYLGANRFALQAAG